MGFLSKLQNIDRRIMYLLLVVVVAVPLIAGWILPAAVLPEVQSLYDTVEQVPPGKIAIVSIVWASGTIAESGPQTEAIMRHLFKKGIPFAILPWDQQGTTLAQGIAERVSKEMGKEYGRDWVNWGYRPPYIMQFLKALARDVHRAVGKDINGTPIQNIPMMRGVRTHRDIGITIEITPSGTVGDWIAFWGEPYQIPIGYCPTAVMVPEGYNYLDAKQIAGMLPGMVGAAEYETLVGHKGEGLQGATALSTSHLLIIALIVLGNLGFLAARRRREEA